MEIEKLDLFPGCYLYDRPVAHGPIDVEMLESPHTGESLSWIGRCDQLPGSQGVAAREATSCHLIPGTTSDDDGRGANLMRLGRLKYTGPFKLKLLDTFM
jgi:hypothetical protein